ncbi:MAG: septum formation inhibitor Maf [Verrucomicrobia bacterium]|nr:septum formation inhibitor Maf [Verrucomicrobiota bacterium]MCH8513297.1 Maf family protein [Kiritimatiellia bacterium]
MQLILASSSPRRRQLLADAGFQFSVCSPEVDESLLPNEKPVDAVVRLAREKAAAVAALHPDAVVLAADTAVVLDGAFLGKPADVVEAAGMLRALSGREHDVITGFALASREGVRSDCCRTRVAFRDLDDAEIEAYIATGEPMDKAGAYGIQSGAAHMVNTIHGSYTNVVGLPMAEVFMFLRQI